MKGIFIPMILAAGAITIAAATTAKHKVDLASDKGTMLDSVIEACYRYRVRREYLSKLDPNGSAKIAECMDVLNRFKRKLIEEEGKEETVASVTNIQNTINEGFEDGAKLRDECLAREWPFNEDGYIAKISDCDLDDLRSIYRQIVEATNEIESCINRIEFWNKRWNFVCKLSTVVFKALMEEDDPTDETKKGANEDKSDNGDGDSKK